MITIGVGNSSDQNAFKAGAEAVKDALLCLKEKTPIGGIVLSSVSLDQDQFLAGVASSVPKIPLAGGSTAGEISSEGLSGTGGGVVMLFASDQMTIASSAVHHIGANPRGSGGEFARRAREVLPTSRHGVFFIDPLSGNLDEFLAGFAQALEGELSLMGTGAGDDFLYRETFQYRDTAAHTRSATALLFSGEYTIATASTHGFIPVGMPEEVTKSMGSVILEIGGKPAIDIYRSYFGAKNIDLLTTAFSETTAVYPLGVRSAEGHVVQIPTALSKAGGLEFFQHVPEGSEVRLMVGDIDGSIEGAREAAREMLRGLGGKTLRGVIICSSAARRRLLGVRADDEIRAIQDIVGRDTPIAGMCGYAEILGVPPTLSQATMTIWGIAE